MLSPTTSGLDVVHGDVSRMVKDQAKCARMGTPHEFLHDCHDDNAGCAAPPPSHLAEVRQYATDHGIMWGFEFLSRS